MGGGSSAPADGPAFSDPSGGWKAFNTIYAADPTKVPFDVTMEYLDGECQYNLYGNGCEGLTVMDDGSEVCGGPCTVDEDEGVIGWTDKSGLAAANPVLQNQQWTKDGACWGPFAPEGRKYGFSAELDLGNGPMEATFWLWQE